jgi:photosystem II stability/assembly factor-like uncharacterized protein
MNDGGQMAVSPHSSDVVFCTGNVYNAAYFLGVSHTSDGGTTWEHDTLPMGSRGWAVAFDPIDPNRVYVGGDSNYSYPALLITTDLGATWAMSRTGLNGTVNALATVPNNGQLVYAGTNNGVFRSTDAGATWAATSLTQQTRALVVDPANTGTMYAGTYGAGVYASTDGGATWSAMNAGLTCNKVLALALRSGPEVTLFAGTEGGSVFLASLPTAIAGTPGPGVRSMTLAVSPNPCFSSATIRLSSPLTAPSSLILYNASGRLVASFPIRTPCFTLPTSRFSPGAYFVRLVTGTKTYTARLTILK